MTNLPKLPSNRSFGIVFFFLFFAISFYSLIHDQDFTRWSLGISIIFLILGLINSKILTPLNRLWFKFGILLGRIMSPIIMALIFFVVVTPIGLIMKTLRRDILNLKYDKEIKSYWTKKDGTNSKMKNQF